ncbi:MAG: M23 family metallopeptidase [Acidobacteriota bacterium]
MASTSNTNDGSTRPLLEVQIHPGDIRKKVRYVFFTRQHLGLLAIACLAWLVLVGSLAFTAAPVLESLLARTEHRELIDERARQGEHLQLMVARLSGLEGSADKRRIEMARIHLAYGFSPDASHGQGGFPFIDSADPLPDSIYGSDIRRGYGLRARTKQQLAVIGTFLDEVQSFEAAHRDQVRTTPSRIPMRADDFVLTSPFGDRTSPFTKKIDFHPGIDLAAPEGAPIFAPADGVVAFAGRYPLKRSVGWWRYGNLVILKHGDRFVTIYGHCEDVLVSTGEKVEQGQLIATVGDTGWSTSPHLHYEVRRAIPGTDDFEPIDPRIYILDHQWRDQEKLLIQARRAPDAQSYEPLPRTR